MKTPKSFYAGFACALMYAQSTNQTVPSLTSRLPDADDLPGNFVGFDKDELAAAIQDADEGGVFFFRFSKDARGYETIEMTNSEMDADMPDWANG